MSGGGPASPLGGGSAAGGPLAGHGTSAGAAAGAAAGTTAGPRTSSQGVTLARRNPRAIATSPTPIKIAELWPLDPLITKLPASVTLVPVVAVSVWAWFKESSQTAVLRSWVNSAFGADVISCGTVSENVILMIEDSWSAPIVAEPGDGDGIGCAWVLNV